MCVVVCYTPYFTIEYCFYNVCLGGGDWQEQVGNSSLGGKSPV